MKQLLIFLAAVYTLSSCSEIAGWSGSEDSTGTKVDSTVVYRDVSITEANAYSDLFLDSSAIESFIKTENVSDTTAKIIRDFYAVRNYQFAWFATSGLTEQARGLWSLYPANTDLKKDKKDSSSGKTPSGSLKEKMDTLLLNDSLVITKADSSYVETELALTKQLATHAVEHPTEALNRHTVNYLVPAKRMSALEWADSILNRQKNVELYAGNAGYQQLKKQLSLYHNLAKNGGWTTVPSNAKNIRKGMNDPAISAVRKRLMATGEYTGKDTSGIYNDSLEAAIKLYQQRNGFAATGRISDSLVTAMNIPAEERLQQILVNMNRILWMQPVPDSNRIQVNIPSFMLYAYEGSRKVFEMPVIVGKEGTSTVMFSGEISQVVFSPSWNLPESIVKNEILPKMKSDAGYLKKNNMEIVSSNGDLPEIRQLPGKENALGRVKFLFPNNFDIYLHDTPYKGLFANTNRAVSHGCIRVANPQQLAEYIFRDQNEWTPEKIQAAMNRNKEDKVEVKHPLLVSITYFTAWADAEGAMHFRNDVYGHDKEAAQRMFL